MVNEISFCIKFFATLPFFRYPEWTGFYSDLDYFKGYVRKARTDDKCNGCKCKKGIIKDCKETIKV